MVNGKDMRTIILMTNISDFNVRLIDVNHYNKAVTIFFLYCSSYINLEQQKKNILIQFSFTRAHPLIRHPSLHGMFSKVPTFVPLFLS